jgi:nucleoid DNA-binding protein
MNATLTKAAICKKVSTRSNIDRETVKKIVDALVDEIRESLAKGDEVVIRGFGRFTTKTLKARTIKSPKGDVKVPERRRVRFYPSESLNKALKEGDL